jgi:predicted MFS family arabinose efflux permease
MLPPDRPDATTTIREQLGGVGEVVRRPAVLAVLAGGTLSFVMIFGVFLATLPLHLEDEFGFSASIRGLFLSLPAVPSTLVAFNLQRIRVVVEPRALLVGCSLAFGLGFALIASSTTVGLVVLGCLVYGAGEGALIPSLQDLSVDMSPPEHRGAVVAVYVGAARLGQTIGPVGASSLYAATSTFVALWVGAGLAVVLALLFLFTPTSTPAPVPADA